MISNEDLISVIIPVYNVGKYIDRCLGSIVSQDYHKIEVILVDDGSTDNSPAICDKWVSLYPDKIKVFHQNNQGASIARKNGIRAANGTYLTFVDSDDYVHPQYASALYQAAINNGTKVAVCPFRKVALGKDYEYDTITPLEFDVLNSQELFARFFKYEFWGFGGGIYHTTLFKNILYPEATINEDYYVKAQIFSKLDKIGYCPHPLYTYEIHPGSLSNLKLSKRALGEFDNAVATWRFICDNLPQYNNPSLAIASESACKWMGALNKVVVDKSTVFAEYQERIRTFVSHNFFSILFNGKFLWKIKIVLLWEYIKCWFK